MFQYLNRRSIETCLVDLRCGSNSLNSDYRERKRGFSLFKVLFFKVSKFLEVAKLIKDKMLREDRAEGNKGIRGLSMEVSNFFFIALKTKWL